MNPIMIDSVQGVSLRNGVVRVQCLVGGADGEERVSAELAVPANRYGQIVGALQNAAQQLQDRIKEQGEQTEEGGV